MSRILSDKSIPEDLVLVGHVTGAYGIQGWIRIKPYSSDADALLHASTWWINKPELHDVEKMQAKLHGEDLVAQLMGVASRSAAEMLKGAAVHIRRSHFPVLGNNEFYWIDLIGLSVENLQGVVLGVVDSLMDNGAHPILQLRPLEFSEGKQSQEILIPFVDHFVKTVDQITRRVVVDWELDD